MQPHFNQPPPQPLALSSSRRIHRPIHGRSDGSSASSTAPVPTRPTGDSHPGNRQGASRGRSATGYYVYLLIAVHPSYAEAKEAYARSHFASTLPVTYERNANGLGKCKTWLAVSLPFQRRAAADLACRQLAPFAGERAVRVG